jgi:hypothetical protein
MGGQRVNEESHLVIDRQWVLAESVSGLEHLAQSESMFALANGNIGLRGNLDEGGPGVSRGPSRGLTSTVSSRAGRCPTPKPATAIPKPARRS